MGCLRELSIARNTFDLVFTATAGNTLTSIKSEYAESEKVMELSTTGLNHVERILTELLKYEQDQFSEKKKKSFTLLQVLILVRLAKLSKKGIKYEKLLDLQRDFGLDDLDIPDFKMSRNANNLAGGIDLQDYDKQGWGLCDMKVSPENKRWQTIALNKKGYALMKRLSEGK